MTPDELVEKVAEELWQADSLRVVGFRRSVPWSEAGPAAHQQWRPLARAAIALVLGEAARVADEFESDADPDAGAALAAAIRALVKEPTT